MGTERTRRPKPGLEKGVRRLSLSQIKSGRIGDAVRRDVALRVSVRRFDLRAESARPCLGTDACELRCNMSCTIAARAEDDAR